MDTSKRVAGGLSVSNWVTSAVRLTVRGGAARWEHLGGLATAGVTTRLMTHGERFEIQGEFDVWSGRTTFSRMDARVAARSSAARAGAVLQARGGLGIATVGAPADIWFAGDTGQTRDVLLRAHPVVREGRLVTTLLGRRIAHASVEGQYWWDLALTRTGMAVFLDTASVGRRIHPGLQRNVDVGLGARLSIPGVRGNFRADVARGLRDRVTTVSFVYEP
jgi:hypothetical protein